MVCSTCSLFIDLKTHPYLLISYPCQVLNFSVEHERDQMNAAQKISLQPSWECFLFVMYCNVSNIKVFIVFSPGSSVYLLLVVVVCE